jgi:hypothetical protein
METPSIKKE